MENKCATINNDLITRAELFKIFVDIDRQLVKEASTNNSTLNGLGAIELKELEESLTKVLNSPITDEEVLRLATSEDAEIQGLGNVLKKVVQSAGKIVKTAAKAVQKVVTLPARGLITLVLKAFSGKVAKGFIYSFIPDNSPILTANPIVATKANRQKNFLNLLVKGAAFKPDYMQKHIRNAVVKTYKKTPEEVIHDMSKNADPDVNSGFAGVAGLGVVQFAAIAAALVPVMAAVPKIVDSFKPKSDAPNKGDFNQAIADDQNVTGDPAKSGSITELISSPVGIVAGVAVVAAVGIGIYAMSSNKRKRN